MKCTLFFFKPLTSRQNDENYLIVLTDKDLGYRNKICDKKKNTQAIFQKLNILNIFHGQFTAENLMAFANIKNVMEISCASSLAKWKTELFMQSSKNQIFDLF